MLRVYYSYTYRSGKCESNENDNRLITSLHCIKNQALTQKYSQEKNYV